MQRKRRWYLTAGVSCAGLSVLSFLFIVIAPLRSPVDPIQYENYAHLPGMTTAEVEELLGCPPGVYLTGPAEEFVPRIGRAGLGPPVRKYAVWEGDRARIKVGYDENGRCVDLWWDHRPERPPFSFWEFVRSKVCLKQ